MKDLQDDLGSLELLAGIGDETFRDFVLKPEAFLRR